MVNPHESGRTGGVDVPPAGDTGGVSKGKAFLGLFLKAQRRIFAYIFTLLPNRTDAEDVLQEVSKLMWERFDEADPPGDFVAWGCRIAFYKVMEHRVRPVECI
jgi:RNA polymerase sigma-70 factor, ECF subfamily